MPFGCHYAFVCDLSERILPTLSNVPRSVHSEFAVCGYSPLTVHVAIPVRDADGKNSSSIKQNRRDKYLLSVEQNGRQLLYGDFSD